MVRYLEYIALFLAIVAVLGACSNSLEAINPFDDSLSIQFESCDHTESGDIRYKAENDEYSTCIDDQWMHVDIKTILQDVTSDENDTTTLADTQPCNDGDKKFKATDSTYEQCSDGKWKTLNENWVVIPVTERFLQVQQGKFIPNANFNTPFTLQPPQALNNGEVKCTFDGSEPDATTPNFSENRLIDSTTVVRCYEFVGSEIKQKQTETYFINERIDMPVVSISVDPTYVRDYLDAEPCQPDPCYGAKFWEDVEYPAHVEYFAEGSSAKEKGFEIDAGISIAGHWSRNQQKKSVAIVMRKEYQDGRLHYPLFETRPESNKFKAFILRNNGQRFISDYIGDALATSLLEGTNVDYQRSRMVVAFFDGLYRGIYDLREKLNEHFIETNYGIQNEKVNFIKLHNDEIIVHNGSDASYKEIKKILTNYDFQKDSSAYELISQKIDIANFIEYNAAQIYYHNGDWPDNNVKAWEENSTKWRFIVYDTDYGWGWTKQIFKFSEDQNMIEWILHGGKNTTWCDADKRNSCFNAVFANLLKNENFKRTFINRAAYLYSTHLNSQKIHEQIDKINKSIDKQQIIRDMKTYQRTSYTNLCSNSFDPYGDCLKTWAMSRDKNVRNEFRQSLSLGNDALISIEIKGNGLLKLDGIYVSQSNLYKWIVFENHPMQLTVECFAGAKSISWDNGSTAPNRIIYPKNNLTYSATCE